MTTADVPAIRTIMREPSVTQWGIDLDNGELVGPLTFLIEDEGNVVGWVGGYENVDPEYRYAGLDIFLSTAAQGRGIGPEAIRLACRFLFDTRGHHRIVIDPAAANTRAIRAYEKVGFKRVGIMREYERGPDGTFHDGMLMDLLRSDLDRDER